MKKNLASLKLVGVFFMAAVVIAIGSCRKNEKPEKPVYAAPNPAALKFNLYTAGDHADFYITCVSSNKVLEIGGTSLANGGTADQSTYLGAQPGHVNQKWKITAQGDGTYKFMNLGSGKYLEVTSTQSQVFQDQSSTTAYQLWYILNVAPGQYRIQNKATGFTLTNYNDSQTDGTPVYQAQSVNNTSQYWTLTMIAADSYRDDDVVRFFQRTSGSEAFDGGSSIALSTGQVLWTSGDVYYNQLNSKGEFNCGQIFNYHNSMLVQPASHSWDPTLTLNALSPNGVQVFHDSNSKNLIWPGSGIQVGNNVYIHGLEVPIGTLTASNQYLCDVTESADGKTLNAVNALSIPNMSGQTAITYSIGMVNPGDGYVYAYGAGGFLNASVFVARFSTGSPTVWTFWNGSTWAAAPTTASAAVVAQGPVNNNTIGYVHGKYVMIAMDFGFECDVTSHNVYSYTSISPTGPFTHKTVVYQVPDRKQGHTPVFYIPYIHSEFDNGQSELLVTYCVNFYSKNDGTGAKCLTDCSNPDGSEDPNDYRLKAFRIPYSLIGL